MKRSVWINIASTDVLRAVDFYQELGFKIVDNFPRNPSFGGFYLGDTPVMIFHQTQFSVIANSEKYEYHMPTGMFISYRVDSLNEANRLVDKAISLGAIEYNEGMEVDGQYHRGFIDFDGHRFDIVTEKF